MTKVITAYETVSVKRATKQRLASFGRKNQTYDELVNEILDAAAPHFLTLEQRRALGLNETKSGSRVKSRLPEVVA